MNKKIQMPPAIAAFIEATNEHNTAKLLTTLTDKAVLTDEGQEYRGVDAIKDWSDAKLIGSNVTFRVVDMVNRNDDTIVTVAIDGNFDKTGLPDPFCMDLHFTIEADKVAQLNFRFTGDRGRRERFADIILATLTALPL